MACVIMFLLVMASPVGGAIKGGLTDSTDGVKSTGTEVQAKAGNSIKSLAAGENAEEDVPDTVFVGYNSSSQTLVFSHDENSPGYSSCDNKFGNTNDENDWTSYNPYDRPWYSKRNVITNVSIENKVKPKNTSCWFLNLKYLESINGLNNIDTSSTTAMESMFTRCEKITQLDLSNFDTSKVVNMNSMFYNCGNLNSINYGSKFVKKDGADIDNMFYNCPANKPSWW